MFRKLGLCLAGGVAVVALSGCAFLGTEPACDAYDNQFAVAQFELDTPTSFREHAVSDVRGSFLLCGTSIGSAPSYEEGGSGTQFVRLEIEMPPNVRITSMDELADGSYVGGVNGNMVTWVRYPEFAVLFGDNQPGELRIDKSAGSDCPLDAVTCYKATSPSVRGHSWSWVTRDAAGRYTFTIGRLHDGYFDDTVPAGFTKVNDVRLCGRAGLPGTSSCGDRSQPAILHNGDASRSCEGGKGVYTITGTNRAGETTAPVQVCVAWKSTLTVPPDLPSPGDDSISVERMSP